MHTHNKPRKTATALAIAAATLLGMATANAQQPNLELGQQPDQPPAKLFEAHVLPDSLVLEPLTDQGLTVSVDLIVTGPEGFYLRKSFPAGELVEFNPASLADGALPDGTYVFETRIMSLGNGYIQRGQDEMPEIEINTRIPNVSGAFSINNGQIVIPQAEPDPGGNKFSASVTSSGSSGTQASNDQTIQDQVILDDLIVDGSLCVGFDCVNGESFGFDTIRMKENNTRIKFDDTSSSASFPNNDWQLTANESTNGGLNKFSIENTTVGRIPFTIEGPAPSNSLYVDDGGRIGIGTSTPVVETHIVDGDTPTVRLEQDGSSGFTPQTWDVAGNETNFFVRDVTNGSRLPFRIRPSAPTSSIDIAASGNVGIGTASPSANLHVRGTGGSTSAKIEEASGTNAVRTMLTLENNGGSRLRFEDTSNDLHDWLLTANTLGFAISEDFSGVQEFILERGTGNLTIAGTLTQNSDRNRKTNISPVDPEKVLAELTNLQISTWAYLEDPDTLHLGPMAQDFHTRFRLGNDERSIATIDTSGVALAAIQGLKQQLDRKQRKIDALSAEIQQLRQNQQDVRSLRRTLESMIVRIESLESARQESSTLPKALRVAVSE